MKDLADFGHYEGKIIVHDEVLVGYQDLIQLQLIEGLMLLLNNGDFCF